MLRAVAVALLAALSACSGRAVRPSEPVATLAPAEAQPVLAAQAAPLSRRQRVQRILPSNVRVFVHDGDVQRRSASGVVVGRDATSSYVLTNAHVVDGKEPLARPRLEVVVDRRTESRAFDAEVLAVGSVPDLDLAVLRVPGLQLPPAPLATDDELLLGEEVLVAGAPFGRPLSISGGMISQVEWDRTTGASKGLKTDAAIGYGTSGGGVFALESGKLVAIVEGYRTAKVAFEVAQAAYSFDVPMPGETFAAPAGKIRRFLEDRQLLWILGEVDGGSSAATAAAAP